MNATLQLGPDAVGARHQHRLRNGRAIEPEQPAERTDLGEHTGRERGAGERFDTPDGLVAGVDVDAGLHGSSLADVRRIGGQNSSFPISVCVSPRAGDPVGGLPVTSARSREKPLLLEVLFEHVERLGEQLDRRPSRIRVPLEDLHDQRRIPQRDGADRQGDGDAGRIVARGMPMSSNPRRRSLAAGDAERARPAAAARSSS